jgi:hypothetical protein
LAIIPKTMYPNLAINQIWNTNFVSSFYIFGYTLETKCRNLEIFLLIFPLTSGD